MIICQSLDEFGFLPFWNSAIVLSVVLVPKSETHAYKKSAHARLHSVPIIIYIGTALAHE